MRTTLARNRAPGEPSELGAAKSLIAFCGNLEISNNFNDLTYQIASRMVRAHIFWFPRMLLSMSQPATILPATWEDLLKVPEGYIGEIIGGELVMTPRPGPAHTESASGLGVLLGAPFHFGQGGPGGWIILDEPRVRFKDDIRVPDIAGWRRERYRRPKTGPYTVHPDWICEVLSPGTAKLDRTDKMPLYASSGVKHLWMVDPAAQLIEIYRLHGEKWLLLAVHHASDKIRAEPFDAIELDLSVLWPQDEEPAEQDKTL